MKKIVNTIVFSVAAIILYMPYSGSIYDFSVPKSEGGTQSLSAYQGKKILVITLPVEQNSASDSLLYSLDTLSAARNGSLQVVAVPSIEDGYTSANQAQLKQWYRSKLGNHVLITGGLYTHKSSGGQQHPLFQWLTRESQNEIFDIDADAPGYKFFTKISGGLYAVLRPHTRISSNAVQRTLQMQ